MDAQFKVLLDMHIGDWDERFLRMFDPKRVVALYRQAGVDGALLYFKSHLGLNYWASDRHTRHPIAQDRDIAGEMVSECRKAGIAPAAYVSLTFDTLAAVNHPEWRQRHADHGSGQFGGSFGPRHGLCCPNNEAYRAYEKDIVAAIARHYDVDAIFLDMIFFSMVCRCDSCRARSVAELGYDVPSAVDWNDEKWCRFHEARGRWLDEFYRSLRDTIAEANPQVAVTHNLASELSGWVGAGRLQSLDVDSYSAGDLYGGADEQLAALLIMRNAARQHHSSPPEYMTSFSPDLTRHGAIKSTRQLETQALASAMFGAGSVFIDAVDPSGRVHDTAYQRLSEVTRHRGNYLELGTAAEMVADVAVYYSPPSRVETTSEPQAASDAHMVAGSSSDHERAFFGACRILQDAHLPFGVVTPDALGDLSSYRLLIVPHVARMSPDEREAIRSYVAGGGQLYSSGGSSLWCRESGRLPDFGLRDVFGVSASSQHEGSYVYAKFGRDATGPYHAGAGYVGFSSPESSRRAPRIYDALPLPRIGEYDDDADVLATLTLPYGYPEPGTFDDKMFASSHSSPPWDDIAEPVVVRVRSGLGVSVYSTLPFEEGQDCQSQAAFSSLLQSFDIDHRVDVTGPSSLWVRVFDDSAQSVMIVNCLNYGQEIESGMVTVGDLRADAPDGWSIDSIESVARHGDATNAESVSVEGRRTLVVRGLRCSLFGQFVCRLSRT